jgi:hypothetical protein
MQFTNQGLRGSDLCAGAACRLHTKTVKRLEKRLQVLAADHDAVRQELLIKAAELLDMQSQLKESEGRQQLHQDAATDQVNKLCVHVCSCGQ